MSRRLKGLRAKISASFRDEKITKKKVVSRPAFENLKGQKLHATPGGDVQKTVSKIPAQPRTKKVIPRLTPSDATKNYKKNKV